MAPKPSLEGAKGRTVCQRKMALITRSANGSIRMAANAVTLSSQSRSLGSRYQVPHYLGWLRSLGLGDSPV